MTTKKYIVNEINIDNLQDILDGVAVGPDILVHDNDLVDIQLTNDATSGGAEIVSLNNYVKAEFVGVIDIDVEYSIDK